MKAYLESEWLRQNIQRWSGAITIQNQTIFAT